MLSGHSHTYERSFLIDGHYGTSSTFTNAMKKDGGSGRADGTWRLQQVDAWSWTTRRRSLRSCG